MNRDNPYQIVLDTSVLVSGLRSTQGASYKFLTILNDSRWQVNVSVGLVLEYEAVLKRNLSQIPLTSDQIDRVLNDICSFANHRSISYQWRPISPDPDDDFIIDLAVASQSDFIITYNQKDLEPAAQFGIQVVTPKQFLQIMGEL
jgi:putative PIN family toxin of toxin-antitoxin system